MWLVNYNDFSLFHEEMKVILWSIHTFWYKGLAKTNEKSQVLKKALCFVKIIVRIKKPFSPKGQKTMNLTFV